MLRSLQIFVDLVTTENFTETADRNYLTQSAVSRHIKSLEEKLGHRLIARGRGQFQLTSAGKLTHEAARDVLARMDELEQQLHQDSDIEITGILRIHTTQIPGIYRLPDIAGKFLTEFPKIDLQIEFSKNKDIYESLLSGAIDLGIVEHPKPHPELNCEIFNHEPLVLIVPHNHELATQTSIKLKELNGQAFVTAHQGVARRDAFDKLIEDHNIQISYPYAFDNVEIVKAAVKNSMGIALMPRIAVHQEAGEDFVAVEINDRTLKRPLGVLHRKAEPLTAAAKGFLDTLVNTSMPSPAMD